MTDSKLAVVILAAGQGTRMKSARPKVLHSLAGKPMLDHVLDTVSALSPEQIVVVVGPDMAEVAAAAAPHRTVMQQEQLGTGHAVASARAALGGFLDPGSPGDVLVVFGDTPLLTVETLQNMVACRRADSAPDILGLAFTPGDPAQYGRVILGADGQVLDIVEYADTNEEQRRVGLCNAGVVLGDGAALFALIDKLGSDNAKGEYYLTDIYGLARREGFLAKMAPAETEEVMGINSRAELAVAEAVLQTRLRGQAMAAGVTLVDPTTVWFCSDTKLGRDVVVQPNVFFGPGVTIGDDVEIRSFSHIEGARIEAGATVGPFARLRPGTVVGAGARVGNFVEIKNAVLGQGAKVGHLTYLGDTDLGEGANVGAGTITCNYDGFAKHRTVIGAGAFIGSNTALVAPVTIGDGAIVGAGSTITKDVAADALAVTRSEQQNSKGAAARFRKNHRTDI